MVIKVIDWLKLNKELNTLLEKLKSTTDEEEKKQLENKIEYIKNSMQELDTRKCNHIFVKSREQVYDMYESWSYSTECIKCGLSDGFFNTPGYEEAYWQFEDLRRNFKIGSYLLSKSEYYDTEYIKKLYEEALLIANNPFDREEVIAIIIKKIEEDKIKNILKRGV